MELDKVTKNIPHKNNSINDSNIINNYEFSIEDFINIIFLNDPLHTLSFISEILKLFNKNN